jgi:flagella basal body P-ring formation protein FlgA
MIGLLVHSNVTGQTSPTQSEQSIAISKEAENFLRLQTSQLTNEIEVSVKPIDSRLKLQTCDELTGFLPPGTKAWGKVTVGVRCTKPKPWTIYLAAQVRVFGDYYVTKNAVNAGQKITENDVVKIRGEISNQAPGTILSIDNALGKTMLSGYPAGVSLRTDMFKLTPIIQQGQSIKVISQGAGFRVSNDAIALNNASEGQITKAKTQSGVLVSGIARSGGFIEVQ